MMSSKVLATIALTAAVIGSVSLTYAQTTVPMPDAALSTQNAAPDGLRDGITSVLAPT